jgi:hypothetical protein
MTSNAFTIAACGVAIACEMAVQLDLLPWLIGVAIVMAAFFIAARHWKIRIGSRGDGT